MDDQAAKRLNGDEATAALSDSRRTSTPSESERRLHPLLPGLRVIREPIP